MFRVYSVPSHRSSMRIILVHGGESENPNEFALARLEKGSAGRYIYLTSWAQTVCKMSQAAEEGRLGVLKNPRLDGDRASLGTT